MYSTATELLALGFMGTLLVALLLLLGFLARPAAPQTGSVPPNP